MGVSLEKAVIARLKYKGEKFEVLVDPEKVEKIREKARKGEKISSQEILDILATEEVYRDAKKGERVSEEELMKIFGTDDVAQVALKIILEGEVQLTAEQRRKKLEELKRQIAAIIARKAVDPRTGTPHPMDRILRAMEEAGISLDIRKSAEEQVKDVLKELRKILPIKMEVAKIQIRIPPQYAGKAYSLVHKYITAILKENWLNDGTWEVIAEVPAGIVPEFLDKLGHLTKGAVETAILERKESL